MKDWTTAIVRPDAPMEHVIAVLDRSALRIALVNDEGGRLVGTITDGDIRRGLLRHLSLDAPAHTLMCTTPTTAPTTWTRQHMLSVMEERQLLQLPIVDSEGRVVGLETMHGLLRRQRRDNPVFLMAGGLGTRLWPLTSDVPKPLLRVGDKPMLELIIDGIAKNGFHRFFISTHYRPEMIREYFGDGSRWGVDISYVHEDSPLGTGGALSLLPREEITLPLLMMNGDVLTTLDHGNLLRFHDECGGDATVGVSEYAHQVPFGVIHASGNRITSMTEKPVQKWFVNTGIYVLSPELIHGLAQGEAFDMPSWLQKCMEGGRQINMFPVHESWMDVGRPDDLARARGSLAPQEDT